MLLDLPAEICNSICRDFQNNGIYFWQLRETVMPGHRFGGFMAAHSLAVVGHVGPGFRGKAMAAPHALAALAALGQPTRLEIFRLLVRREPKGLPAGAIAEAVGCPHNTLSTHIAILARSGLVQGNREGRTITYRADAVGIRALIAFLVTDCCDGRPELCALTDPMTDPDCGCAPAPKQKKKRK
jgi:ArsR family transcriptional regulator